MFGGAYIPFQGLLEQSRKLNHDIFGLKLGLALTRGFTTREKSIWENLEVNVPCIFIWLKHFLNGLYLELLFLENGW